MTTAQNTQNAVDGLATGLGTLVIHHLFDTQITPNALRGILANEGDDASIVPDIDSSAAIRDAARQWRKGRGNAERYRTEVAFESDAVLVIGILKRNEDADAQSVSWEQVDSLAFNKFTDSWDSTGASAEAAEFFHVAEGKRFHLDHNWIRPNLIQARMSAWGAFSLRRQGGVYYVPRQHDDDVDRLARIVGQIGDCRLDLVTVSDSAKSRASIGGRAGEVLGEGLGAIRAKIDEWTERTKGVRSDAVGSALEELRTMRAHAMLYADALGLGLDDLNASIDQAVALANELLTATPTAQDERPASDKVRARIEETIVKFGMVVTHEQLAEMGWPASSYKHSGSFWSDPRQANRATLRDMGLRAVRHFNAAGEGHIDFVKVGPESEPVVAPEPPAEPTAALESLSVQDLYARYEQATGEPAPRLRKGFNKVALAQAVAQAELATA